MPEAPSEFNTSNVGAASQPCSSALAPGASGPAEQDPLQRHWIEIELLRADTAEPVSGVEYCITLPDGAEARGYLGRDGRAKVRGIESPGNCQITFPGLYKDDWE